MAKRRTPHRVSPPGPSEARPFSRLDLWVALGIAVLTAIAYAAVPRLGFLLWDDNLYVTDNRFVARGFTWEGLRWALTANHANNWHPLTWMSHMLDVQLFGMNAAAHHVVNLLLHIAAAIVLFLALLRMGGGTWRSAFVAALFAVHPAHVESVAWLSERKDVLGALFWMLALWGYVEYVRRPGLMRYLGVLVPFALGLAAKPMLVTLPFALLLLDVWPLGRVWGGAASAAGDSTLARLRAAAPRLLAEKLPLFALAAASSCVTFVVQQKTGAVADPFVIPAWLRFANPLVSYVAYLGKLLWPADLAALYPYPKSIPAWQAIGSLALLAGVTVLVLREIRRRPWLAVGWLWFLGTLVPVIGWVQVGRQAMADRYTYIPFIGLFVMIAWGVPELLARRPGRAVALATAGGLAVAACVYGTWMQVPKWRDGVTLWTHTLAVTRENAFAHFNLGVTLADRGQPAAALGEYAEALRIDPQFARGYNNLGAALMDLGKAEEAMTQFDRALSIAPRYPEAHHNMGRALVERGRLEEAVEQFRQALADDPDYAPAHIEMGIALMRLGRADDAIIHYTAALRLQPDHPAAHNNLGTALERRGRIEQAIQHYAAAVRLNPGYAVAHFNLGAALGRLGREDAAIPQYLEALRTRPDYVDAHNNLGAALANLGRIDEAIPHFEEALRLRPGNADAQRNLDSARVMLRAR